VRTFQIPKPFMGMTVLENLCIPLEYAAPQHTHSAEVVAEARQILEHVGLAARANAYPAGLTQIDMRKIELARAMAARPQLLIADEVMAGLSSGEVDDILTLLLWLNEQGMAIIMIEHIMRAVMRFSERLMVLDAGEKIAEGSPEAVVNNPAVEKAYLGA
jgi:branched-chain amino acid transport system ATP-binding protein